MESRYLSIEPLIEYKSGFHIVLYHGWGTSIESFNSLGHRMAQAGHRIIIPEILYHDSRNRLKNPFTKEAIHRHFWETIFMSIEEFSDLAIAADLPVSRTVVIGSSMGGFIANGIFSRMPNLAGAASINGSGSFLFTEKRFREIDGRPKPTEKEEANLREFDPKGKGLGASPILLLHGSEDRTIPVEGQKDYYGYLIESGKSNVELKLYEGINHQFSEEMVLDLIGWLADLSIEEIISKSLHPDIRQLLAYATSEERIEVEYAAYQHDPNRRLYGLKKEGNFIGCIGVEQKGLGQLEIIHLAVSPVNRKAGAGKKLVEWVFRTYYPKVMIAETDSEAVGFYRKLGFEVHSLGEKYPGVERFLCKRSSANSEEQNK